MRKLLTAAACVLGSAGAVLAQGASPVGTWMTEGGKSHVQISQCGAQLCGRIIWLREPNQPSGQPKVDIRNPDQSKRGQKIVGLQMLWGFNKSSDPGEWEGGRIYNPEDGETYKSTMKLRSDGKLEVRGYVVVPLLGGSQYWERVP